MRVYTELEASTKLYNYLKVYPSFSRLFVFKEPINIISDEFEAINSINNSKISNKINLISKVNSIRRTKTRISDLVLSNKFDMFVTFTFKSNRQDINLLKNQLSNWIHNQKRIHGEFSYILVPEFHKDGKSIHFHGLLSGYNGKVVFSGKIQRGRQIYNVTSYRLGFSTLAYIDNTEKVSSYIKKYITKDMPTIKGKKRYWCSKDLTRPIIHRNVSIEPTLASNLQQSYAFDNLTIYHLPPNIAAVTTKRGLQLCKTTV